MQKNNSVFGKTMEKVRKHRNTQLLRNYLVSKSNYHTTKLFTENLLAIEMRKTKIIVNKPVYLGLTVMYEFYYDL